MLKKIASSTLSQVFSKVITAVITIFLLGLITNYLTVELFGTYNKIFNYIFIFAFLVDLGLYAITIKEISANKKNTEYIFGNILSLRLISAFFVIIFSVGIAYFLPGYDSNLVLFGIFLASIFTFFSLINSNLLALMQAYMKMEFSILSVVLNKIFVLILTYLIIFHFYPKENILDFNNSFLLIIGSVSVGMFINMLLNYLYAKKITNIKFYFDFKYIKKIFIKSLPYGIALFLSVVYTKIDIILISLIEDGLIAERSIALYSLPLKIMDVFMIIGGFFMNSLLPNLSENFKNKNFKKIKEIINNALKVMFGVGVILVSLGLNFKDNVVKIIANDEYLITTENNLYTSSDAFFVILFMILFFYLGIVFSYLLISMDKQKKLLKISIILTLTNIIGNIILIPYLSFIGAGIVTVVTQVIFLFLVYFEVNKHIKIKLPFKFIFLVGTFGIFIYFFTNFIISNFHLGLYLDLFYAIIIFLLYSLTVWKISNKK